MKLSHAFAVFGFLVGMTAAAVPAQAQASREGFLEAVEARQSDMEFFRAELNSENADRRLAAMEYLIREGDVTLSRMAREVGLLSADPKLRNLAVLAFLDSQPRLRIEVTPDEGSEEPVRTWISYMDFVDAGTSAGGSFQVGPWDEQRRCWLRPGDDDCQVVLSGEVVNVYFYFAVAALNLDEQGRLVGTINTNRGGRGSGSVVVDLLE